MAKIITKEQAAELFFDGAVVCGVAGGSEGWPEEIALAVEKRFLETAHPAGMTHIHAAGLMAADCWAHDGLLALDISSYESVAPKIAAMIEEDRLPAWYLPMGAILQTYSEMGRGMPGALSRCGLGTFMDSRVDGGALNPSAAAFDRDRFARGERRWVEHVPDFMGDEFLFYSLPKIDIGIMRATTADEHGNITTEHECMNLELGAVARAAKASGGIVIVEVERIARAGSLNPKLVKIGQNLVDYIVVHEHPELVTHGLSHRNYKGIHFWDGLNGQLKIPTDAIPVMPFDVQKVMIRRVLMEMPRRGALCNFGIGLPSFCGGVLTEQGEMDNYIMISEVGAVGGVPGSGLEFACHWNNEWACDHKDHFDWFDGTGIDFGVFGLPEAQEDGSINVSRLNGVTLGVGGFTNITDCARKAVFTGTFTAKGLKEHIEDGKLIIDQEGRLKKFVKRSEQIAFDARLAAKKGKPALFVTERAVLEVREDGVYLLEIAPGMDLQTDILDQMEFVPKIPAEGVRPMPPEIFQEEWYGLSAILDARESDGK